MTNMFSGNQEKKIPKNFKECYETDSITQNLWVWCERLEKWGFRLCLSLAIWGVGSIISSVIDAITEGNNSLIALLIITSALKWVLFCFLEYCSYHILALLIGSLANIVQHTKITANIKLYNSAKAEGIIVDSNNIENIENKEKPVKNNSEQSNFSEVLSKIPNTNNGKTWECKICGSKNPQNSLSCKTCGNYK